MDTLCTHLLEASVCTSFINQKRRCSMFLLQRKNGTYYIQYLDPATKKYIRKSIGTKSKKEAMAFFKQFDPIPKQPINQIKFSEFWDEYIKYVAGNKTKKYSKSIELSFRQLMNYKQSYI